MLVHNVGIIGYGGFGRFLHNSWEKLECARVVAVADVFDALTTSRPYKEPWPIEKAVDLLNEEKGKHFDPELVDHFLDNLDEVKEIFNNFAD